MKNWKKIRYKIEYGSVAFLMLLIRLLPLRLARSMGAALGWIAFRVFRIRRNVTLTNLKNALGDEWGESELRRIGSRSYQNLGRSLVEFACFGKLSGGSIRSMVSFEGLDHLDRALQAGKGAVFIAAHFDNWELLGTAIGRRGYPMHFLVGEQSNKAVDNLMNKLRKSQGIGIITRKAALKKVLRTLSENQIIALLPDQNAGKMGVFVDFFGMPASTYKGPATFAFKQGCPLVPGFIIRKSNGRHHAVIEKPIWPDLQNDKEKELVRLTQAYTKVIETYVRRYPDHYFWPHRRWKTRPVTD